MTPTQNRLRRLLLPTVSPIYDGAKRIGRIMTRLDKDFQPKLIEYSEIEAESEVIKLKYGDYTLPMTEQQWNELLGIENWKGFGLTYIKTMGMLFDGAFLLHAHTEFNPTTLLTFEQFKQRAINTFKK